MPNLNFDEAIETTKINSIVGKLSREKIIFTRPFRSPHYTITPQALVGGGSNPKPGEISLAHNGTLFLDEIAEFDKKTLELLREPLESKNVTINRLNQSLTYPCNFMLVAAMNPCPCGYYGSEYKKCTCKPTDIKKYLNKISGPLLDRIDIQVEVQRVGFDKLKNDVPETSAQIRSRVEKAIEIQANRYKNEKILYNSELEAKQCEKYCILDEESKNLLQIAFQKFKLSARAYSKILKIARTIADLENEELIKKNHIAEAIQYRNLDKKYIDIETV